jgi:Ni/Fe-hydrogenase subunit HybB-like protein
MSNWLAGANLADTDGGSLLPSVNRWDFFRLSVLGGACLTFDGFLGPLLAALCVIWNRMNVVLFAREFKGPMPWTAPKTYFASLVERGVSIGLIAAKIFLVGTGARLMPLRPTEEACIAQ